MVLYILIFIIFREEMGRQTLKRTEWWNMDLLLGSGN